MAGNEWVNSYLEAILDVGGSVDDVKKTKLPSLLLRERGRFSPTRYFVEEVITGFDETDLHRSWVKAAAMRSSQERNTRLENMCWRIWNLARKKKQLEGEEAQRLSKFHFERERGRREATADLSDLSEGEKGEKPSDGSVHGGSMRPKMLQSNSVDSMDNQGTQPDEKKLYIVLISLHGLIRGEDLELGRDSDTGGQVKYVVELARALGVMPGVYRVDLLTRKISAPDVHSSYAEPIEKLNTRNSESLGQKLGESSGAYIVRIPFGPKDKYIEKELLWPHIPEFVDRAIGHIIQTSKVISEQVGGGEPVSPVAIHGHYADAGDSAALLCGALNVPMVFTGHSLGRDKLEQLLKQGRLSREEINDTYKIMRRIEAEELSLDTSEIIITSTRQEIEEQWSLYDGFDLVIDRKLKARHKRNANCCGKFMPQMNVIPPGIEFKLIVPHDLDMDGEMEPDEASPGTPTPDPPIWSEIMRFFTNPRKPMILALARADPKKNITTLVKAFGECRPLRELSNLTLIMGNRDDIDEMCSTNASVLLSVLKLIDKYDLYGQVAYPKHHKQTDVPDIYRLAAKTKGVFINPAFIEPFGLTLIEAAAYGLPIVATKNGGPVDIHKTLDNGLLIDPHDQQSIADALLNLVADKQLWANCRQNGLKNIHRFSWPEHCKKYLSCVLSCKPRHPHWVRTRDKVEDSESVSPGAFRDMKDMYLNWRLSLDSEKKEGTGAPDKDIEPKEKTTDSKTELKNGVLPKSNGVLGGTQYCESSDRSKLELNSSNFRSLGRRKYVFVIAVDSNLTSDVLAIINAVVEASGKNKVINSIGFVLSTALTISDMQSLLQSGGLSLSEYDAFICNSGSEIYYPSLNLANSSSKQSFVVDQDYHSQIDYRWGGEYLRKTLVRWAAYVKNENGEQVVTEDKSGSTSNCFAFQLKVSEAVPPVKQLRKEMRNQGFCCNVIYGQIGSKVNVIPLLASRFQALRYLYIKWGIDISNTVIFAGESGDTDYEGLLGGLHKTVILKGVCSGAHKLHTNRTYPLDHVFRSDSPNIVQIEGCASNDIKAALKKLGILI